MNGFTTALNMLVTISLQARTRGDVRGFQPPPPPLCLAPFFFLLAACFSERGWSCTRILLPLRVWEIDTTFFLGKKKVSESPPPPFFFRAGAPSLPGINCKTPPLKKSCVRHCITVPCLFDII